MTFPYDGLESFADIGNFVPLCLDQDGNVIREVALASIALPLPDHPGETLVLRVALIRDLRRYIPAVPSQEVGDLPPRWDEDLARDGGKVGGKPRQPQRYEQRRSSSLS
ncbi:MAG: hypothetical protein E6I91_01045 [Chloroflexi bacterium]|nr:MAG: hypothetical protein E6I91_01045 [Chloroflexota bacterium]